MVKQNIIGSLPSPSDKILSVFVAEVLDIEPPFIDGIYVTGSLTMNDFCPGKSDIDFLVLCKKLPDKDTASKLKHIHKSIHKEFSTTDLSGCYLSSESIQNNDIANIPVFSYHECVASYGSLQMAPVTLWELSTTAITLFGTDAHHLPALCEPATLYKFLYQNINSYWTEWIKRHAAFSRRGMLLLLFPRLTEWVVLGVARQLYTLQTGEIVSKTDAGNYCLATLPAKFHYVVKEAISIRKESRSFPVVKSYGIRPSFKRFFETIACANYIIDTFNDVYSKKLKPFGED